MIHDHELRDTKRDAAALYRAVLHGDQEGAHAVIGNTRCQGCLSHQTAILGLILAVQDEANFCMNGNGAMTVTGDDRDEIDGFLAYSLDDLNEAEGEQ